MTRTYFLEQGHSVTLKLSTTIDEPRTYRAIFSSASKRIPSGDIPGRIEVTYSDGVQQSRTYYWTYDETGKRKRHTTLGAAAEYLGERHIERSHLWGR